MTCRICESTTREVLDLGVSPPANSFKRSPDEQQEPFPLVLEWCKRCDNVQLRDTLDSAELYRNYLYVTPDSTMLTAHYEFLHDYLVANRLIDPQSFVVEIGSNAGHFLKRLSITAPQILGVDPATRIAAMANERGVPTIADFFDPSIAGQIVAEHGHADLVVARHCLAHNESPHEMMRGARALLSPQGRLVIENAYVLNTLENGEFDQVYHEHMFYFSIRSMKALLRRHNMHLVDVMMSLVHGGSIIFVAAMGQGGRTSDEVRMYEARERLFLNDKAFERFAQRARQIRTQLRELVAELNSQGRIIFTYGATAKGNTLLNFAGFTSEQIPYCVDSTPMKQGLFLPQSNIEVISEETSAKAPPDYFLLTAWNYQDEIVSKVRESGNYTSKFVIPIPFVKIV